MKTFQTLLIILIASVVSPVSADNHGISIFLTSLKPMIDQQFNTTFDDWVMMLNIGEQQGQLQYDHDPSDKTLFADGKFVYTMVLDTEDGKIIASPVYSEANLITPWKIFLSVVYNLQFSQLIQKGEENKIKEQIAQAYRVMLPDFTVAPDVFLSNLDERVVVNHNIFRSGSQPIFDDYVKKYEGCFQNCVKRDISQGREYRKYILELGQR